MRERNGIPYFDGGDGNQTTDVRVEGLGKTAALVLGILSGLSLGASAFTLWALTKTERETRMLEYYLLELDAKVIAAGIKKPDDAIAKKLDVEKRK